MVREIVGRMLWSCRPSSIFTGLAKLPTNALKTLLASGAIDQLKNVVPAEIGPEITQAIKQLKTKIRCFLHSVALAHPIKAKPKGAGWQCPGPYS